jgi:hypothetical protein
MQKLNLPEYPFRINKVGQISEIFDAIRKKYVALTPEEWVRQHIVRYLTEELAYPPSLISIERSLRYNGMLRRTDVVIYTSAGNPVLLIECKAPGIKITEEVFGQIARYNMTLRVPYLAVTNGMQHYCCRISPEERTYQFMEKIPSYEEIR